MGDALGGMRWTGKAAISGAAECPDERNMLALFLRRVLAAWAEVILRGQGERHYYSMVQLITQ